MHIAHFPSHLDQNITTQQTKNLRIGIVQARFNYEITSTLKNSCEQELITWGVKPKNIIDITVAGALELPFALQTLAQTDTFDVLIAIGCVIRGDTYHFEIVCDQSGAGIMNVSLKYDVPIINCVLTVNTMEQAIERQVIKGQEGAKTALEMALLDQI